MTRPMGVRDAEYIELFRGFVDAERDPLEFRKRFFSTYQSDARLGDESGTKCCSESSSDVRTSRWTTTSARATRSMQPSCARS